MPDGDADTPAPAPAPALVSILKDTKSVRTQEFLLLHDLDDIAGGRDIINLSSSQDRMAGIFCDAAHP